MCFFGFVSEMGQVQLYVQSEQEAKLEAQGKFLELLLGDRPIC